MANRKIPVKVHSYGKPAVQKVEVEYETPANVECTKVKIGNTELDETKLIALLALLENDD